MSDDEIPQYHEFLWPALQAVRELGGSASISEMVETVIKRGNFKDEQQAVLHKDGPGTEIAYRLAWARTYLKGMGLLTNSARGVWALTDEGTALITDTKLSDDAREKWLRSRRSAYMAEVAKRKKTKPGPISDGGGDVGDVPTDDLDWKEQLLDHLMAMSPDSFERLSRRLLREADFDSVTVTGKSGDQGIDGVGIYRMGLVTFRCSPVQAVPRQRRSERSTRLPWGSCGTRATPDGQCGLGTPVLRAGLLGPGPADPSAPPVGGLSRPVAGTGGNRTPRYRRDRAASRVTKRSRDRDGHLDVCCTHRDRVSRHCVVVDAQRQAGTAPHAEHLGGRSVRARGSRLVKRVGVPTHQLPGPAFSSAPGD